LSNGSASLFEESFPGGDLYHLLCRLLLDFCGIAAMPLHATPLHRGRTPDGCRFPQNRSHASAQADSGTRLAGAVQHGRRPAAVEFSQASELPQLKAFLESEGMDRGFSDLDTAYNLILISREELIISPTLYHPSFYDRWPEYTRAVRSSEQPVVIIDTRRFREAASIIEDRFAAIGVTCRKTAVGRFVVYHAPSRRVVPEHLHLPGGSLGWEQEVFPFASAAPEHPPHRQQP
jgi:hypothetical protein